MDNSPLLSQAISSRIEKPSLSRLLIGVKFLCYLSTIGMTYGYLVATKYLIVQNGPFHQNHLSDASARAAMSMTALSYCMFFPVSKAYVAGSFLFAAITQGLRFLLGEHYLSSIISGAAAGMQISLFGHLLELAIYSYNISRFSASPVAARSKTRIFMLITQAYTVAAMLTDQPLIGTLSLQVLPILLNVLLGTMALRRAKKNVQRLQLQSHSPLYKIIFRCTFLTGFNRLNQLFGARVAVNSRMPLRIKTAIGFYCSFVVGLCAYNIVSVMRYFSTGQTLPLTIMRILQVNDWQAFVRPIEGDISQARWAILRGHSYSDALDTATLFTSFAPLLWSAKNIWSMWRRGLEVKAESVNAKASK